MANSEILHEYDDQKRRSCAHVVIDCSRVLPAKGITIRGKTITQKMIESAAQQMKSGGVRLFLGSYTESGAGGYDGRGQRIIIQKIKPGTATSTGLLKAMLTHECVHVAHHMQGKAMNSLTDEGLAHAVEALVMHHLNLKLTPLYRAALAMATGESGLGDPVEELDHELKSSQYAVKKRPYNEVLFKPK